MLPDHLKLFAALSQGMPHPTGIVTNREDDWN